MNLLSRLKEYLISWAKNHSNEIQKQIDKLMKSQAGLSSETSVYLLIEVSKDLKYLCGKRDAFRDLIKFIENPHAED